MYFCYFIVVSGCLCNIIFCCKKLVENWNINFNNRTSLFSSTQHLFTTKATQLLQTDKYTFQHFNNGQTKKNRDKNQHLFAGHVTHLTSPSRNRPNLQPATPTPDASTSPPFPAPSDAPETSERRVGRASAKRWVVDLGPIPSLSGRPTERGRGVYLRR